MHPCSLRSFKTDFIIFEMKLRGDLLTLGQIATPNVADPLSSLFKGNE